jgi:hypothetical protein
VAVTDRRTGQTRIVADLQAPPTGLVPAPEASAAPELPPQWIDENWLLSDALFADDQDEVDAVRGAIIRAGPAEPGDDAVRRHYGLSADGTRHSPWTWRAEPESLFLYGAESDLPCVVAVFKDGSLRLERWDAERKRLRRLTRYRHGRWARPTTDAILLAEQVEPEEEGQRPGTRLILWTRRKGRNDIGTLPWLVRPEDLFLLIAPSQSE